MAPVEAASQQDQQHAADAAEHMGELQQVQRQYLQEHLDAPAHGGDHPGAEQQAARRERPQADQRRQKLAHRAHDALQPAPARFLLQQLLAGEQQQGAQERQHIVDAAIEQQGGQQLVHRQVLGQQQAHARLEHPDPAGHMGQHPEEAGQHEGTEQHRIGDAVRRQQHIEHGGGGHPVQQCHQQLQQPGSEYRQHQLVAAPDQHGLWPAQVAKHRQERQPPRQVEQLIGPQRPVRQQGGGLPHQQGRAPPGQQAEKEGHRAEEDDPGHLPGVEPECRVDAIAHRRAGQQGKSQGIGEGVGDKRGDPHLLPGQPLAEGVHRQHVVAAEAAIAEQGQQQGTTQQRQRQRPDGQPDVVPVPEVGQTIEDDQRRPQQQQAT